MAIMQSLNAEDLLNDWLECALLIKRPDLEYFSIMFLKLENCLSIISSQNYLLGTFIRLIQVQ
ncbi:MAG: hypothetical protein ACFFDN_03510 [Candidatus Hodarchaeota archaeon]